MTGAGQLQMPCHVYHFISTAPDGHFRVGAGAALPRPCITQRIQDITILGTSGALGFPYDGDGCFACVSAYPPTHNDLANRYRR